MTYWQQLESLIGPNLGAEDDAALWCAAINLLIHEATFLARCSSATTCISAEIGACSHWLRPHQTRWTANGGFAWPSGYGGSGYSRSGPPEHDWTVKIFWQPKDQLWLSTEPDIQRLEYYTYRMTVPTRTAVHRQAAIPATWRSGTPVLPRKPVWQMYGFRNTNEGWTCTATNDGGSEHYELAAEHPRNKSG